MITASTAAHTAATDSALAALIDKLGNARDAAAQQQVLDQINDLYLDESYTHVMASVPTKMLAKASVRGIEFPLFVAFGVTNAWVDA